MTIEKKRIRSNEDGVGKNKKEKPAKKVIYVEIDDEITAIYDKISKLKHKNVYLVVPQRAILFHSAINLKILKRKAIDLNKNIYIITNDQNGTRLCQRNEIEVFDKLEGQEHPSLVSGKLNENTDLSPLKASINSLSEDIPSRRDEKKLSISELIKKGAKGLKIIPKNITLKGKNSSNKKNSSSQLVMSAPNKKALIFLAVISFIILLFISYIALPGATLILTPKASNLQVSTNVVLADSVKNSAELDTRPTKMIASYKITTKINKVFSYQSTGKNQEGTSSIGIITIENTSTHDWPLIAKTRFQTSDGLVFRISKQIDVPRGNIGKPGTLNVQVTADPVDAFGQTIGARGNLSSPTKFFLPALSANNQKKIFAKSNGNFTGGVTNITVFISKNDIEAAKAKMINDLTDSAETELKTVITQKNQEQGTSLKLLIGPKLIIKSTPKIDIPPNLVNQKLKSFDVKGSMVVQGIAFDRNELISILKTELKLRKNPEKTLSSIDNTSLSYKVIKNDTAAQKIKITATLEGVEEYEISPSKENGARLIKTIKDHIVGEDVNQAREFIRSLPEIQNADINTWPSWAPNLPSVPDNIKIEVKQINT